MLAAITGMPKLSSVFTQETKLPLTEIEDPEQRSVLLRKVIDRIWNSSDRLGMHYYAPIKTAMEEVAKFLHLDRCSFLWYLPETKKIKVICEWVGSEQKSMQGECYPLEEFSWAANALEKIVGGNANDQIFIRCGNYSKLGSFEKVIRMLSQRSATRSPRRKGEHNSTFSGDSADLLIPVCRSDAEETSVQESWIGLIACSCFRPHQWTGTEIDFLQLITQQLEIAIHQWQLYERTQKQAQRERLINQITSQTRQSFDLETILNCTIGQLLDALEVDRCLVHLVENVCEYKLDEKRQECQGNCCLEIANPESKSFWETAHQIAYRRQHLYEVYRDPFPASSNDFDTLGPITQWVIKQRQSVVINDVTLDPRIGEQNEEYQKACIKSSLVVPVQANNVLHAILYLNQCGHNRYWSKSDVELAETVANQLAISINQACLYAQNRASMERESLLRLISNQIRQSLDLKTVLQTTVQQVQNFLATDRVAIYQFTEPDKGNLVVQGTTEKWDAIFQEMSLNRCFLDKYSYPYDKQEIQVINDIFKAQIRDRDLVFLQQLQVRASLVVPIIKNEESLGEIRRGSRGNKLWGLLIVQECNQPRVWKDFEVELLQQIAIQVAIAIQQAELYERSQIAAANAQHKAEALEKALHDLQQAQAQLIQTEKMSSLGQLVAGVAHEINNPVNFIYGNLTYANNYSNDLLNLIGLYQKHYPNPNPEIEECAEDIDLDFLMSDMPKILSSMKVGADRIRQIVLSLRNFSRIDQAEMKPIDIHEGIESTLLILQNRLKANGARPQIEVIKEYGNLPIVECFAGQLNQVFMNIISNAIDALEEEQGKSDLSPTIRISTEVADSDSIIIRIADNGPGMSEQVKKRLFDAFFTTKPVGQGTGLGLSISYQIVVDKHKGLFWCESELGKGTEFWIKIPIGNSY